MRSKHADKFNHDDEAAGYDDDVRDESQPIRAGYGRLLAWCAQEVGPANKVLDLGGGTGNTLAALEGFVSAILVDVSAGMLDRAREKLKDRANVSFVQQDLLEFFDDFAGPVDAVVSTYALHHLEPDEKAALFARIRDVLPPGGRAVFGDLMFRDEAHENALRAKYPELAADFDEEFYWNANQARAELEELGFAVTVAEFSDLSFGITARRGF